MTAADRSNRRRVRAYLGMSLDGCIAGPEDELDWLGSSRPRATGVPRTEDDFTTYDDFIRDVGVILMGRRTFDTVAGFDEWPYGQMPIVVATSRVVDDAPGTVSTASGPPQQLLEHALARADDGDVYVDGGQLVSYVLEAGLLDELTTTIVPTVRGPGIGLFQALGRPVDLELTRVATNQAGLVQLTWELSVETD